MVFLSSPQFGEGVRECLSTSLSGRVRRFPPAAQILRDRLLYTLDQKLGPERLLDDVHRPGLQGTPSS